MASVREIFRSGTAFPGRVAALGRGLGAKSALAVIVVFAAMVSSAPARDPGPEPPGSAPAAAVPQDPDASRPLGVPKDSRALRSPNAPAPAVPRPATGAGVAQTILSLALVVGLILVIAGTARKLARRRGGLMSALGAGGPSPAGLIEILGRYPVARGQTLVLLKLDRRILLLSQASGARLGSSAGFSTLCEITDPDEVASILIKARDAEGDTMAHRFSDMLSGAGGPQESPALDDDRASRRLVAVPNAPDRAELWDDSRPNIPIVSANPNHADPQISDRGAVGALRGRLAALRTMAIAPADGGRQ
jgi:hypothetical protein